jgi:hypothetical protein
MKMKTILTYFVFVAAIFTLMVPASGYSQRGGDAGDADYYGLVKRLKNNDMSVNFQTLRMSYTRTPDYKPYGGRDAKNDAFAALNKKDFAGALKFAQTLLDTNYVDLDIHLLCRIAYRETGNTEKEAFHTSVVRGLANSIFASGDGSSPEKAMVVISVPEEYFVINASGLKMLKQKSITVNGHDYDVMDVENKKTGEKKTLYFNIDIPRQWLAKNLKKGD